MLSTFCTDISSSASNTDVVKRAPTVPSISLNFLSAIGSIAPNKIYSPGEQGLDNINDVPRVAGSGGHAMVQIGRLREDSVDRLVAVKGP